MTTTFHNHWRDVPESTWRWPNFSPAEIACRGTGKLLINEPALDKLQALRDRLGKPLIVRSAYRSPEHNRAVGGATRSKHLDGAAFDIAMANHDPVAFEAAAREVGFLGFGFYPRSGFIHVDLGPARQWGERFPVRATAFAEPKSAEQQARAVAFRTREQLVKQRTEAVNALRSHLYEFGHVAPEGIGYLPRLASVIDDPGTDLPEFARDVCRMLLEQIAQFTARIDALKARIAAMSQEAEMPRQLQTMPGVGPITALGVETFAPPMEQFRRGRDFAAWLGLVSRQHSSGGKQKLGKTSKKRSAFCASPLSFGIASPN